MRTDVENELVEALASGLPEWVEQQSMCPDPLWRRRSMAESALAALRSAGFGVTYKFCGTDCDESTGFWMPCLRLPGHDGPHSPDEGGEHEAP